MKKSDWKDIAELVGIAAIVASLVFVGLQMRQDQRLTETQVFVDSESVVVQLAELLNENRDVWIRGLRNEKLSESEESTFRILARAQDRRRLFRYERSLRVETIQPERYVNAYAYDLYRFPGLRRIYLEDGQFLEDRSRALGRQDPNSAPGFRAKVLDVLAELEKLEVPVDETVNYLF
jgi:hypothetical protein